MRAENIVEVLKILNELPGWRLARPRWNYIEDCLSVMAHAAMSEDAETFADALAALEIGGSRGVTPAGASSVSRAPRQTRLLRSRLLNSLGETRAAGAPTTIEPALDRAIADQVGLAAKVEEQELIIHLFAVADDSVAHARLVETWLRACEVFGLTEPILGLPGELSGMPFPRGGQRVVAGRQDSSSQVQVLARLVDDILVLSALHRAPLGWGELGRAWCGVLPSEVDGGLLGAVWLYLGERPDIGEDIEIVELSVLPDERAQRHLVLLVRSGRGAELSELAWAAAAPEIAPLTRHLMVAAKLRHQQRLWEAAQPELARPAAARLTVLLADLDDMARTAQVCLDNLRSTLPGSAFDLVTDDVSLAEWMLREIDRKAGYLQNDAQRASDPSTSDDPVIAVVTALPEEFVAVAELTDAARRVRPPGDPRCYLQGTMPSAVPGSPHRVLITRLTGAGNDTASEAVAHVVRSFPAVRYFVMVGIAAGIPAPQRPDVHVRLGDIVVAAWGIVDFDHVVDTPTARVPYRSFPRPSVLFGQCVDELRSRELRGEWPWMRELTRLTERLPEFARPPAETDVLFTGDGPQGTPITHPADVQREEGRPRVHIGKIGSSERAFRNAAARDQLAAQFPDLRAIEMEGKGVGRAALANERQWFAMRGISDYGDTHANRRWRNHACAVAAACLRALLAEAAPESLQGPV